MPEAEEGNRTEDGKIVQVRSNVACANKWCKCGQMARRKKCCFCGQMLLSIQPPRVHLAVGVPAVMSPQDTIEHTHLRGPKKQLRTWVYEEIASDEKWRKKEQ